MLALLEHMMAVGFIDSADLVEPLVVDEFGEVVPAIVEHARARAAEGDPAVIERM
jgi:hypothetical protein